MSYQVDKLLPCKGCEEPTNRRENNTRDPLCVTCAIKKACQVQVEMKNRSGPYYDKWLESMRRTFGNRSRGTPPPPNLCPWASGNHQGAVRRDILALSLWGAGEVAA